jgi:hypothetical protein
MAGKQIRRRRRFTQEENSHYPPQNAETPRISGLLAKSTILESSYLKFT